MLVAAAGADAGSARSRRPACRFLLRRVDFTPQKFLIELDRPRDNFVSVIIAMVELAGPYPAGLQSYLVFHGVVSSASKSADAARSLIKFLAAPAAAPVFKAKDMEPG